MLATTPVSNLPVPAAKQSLIDGHDIAERYKAGHGRAWYVQVAPPFVVAITVPTVP